MAHEFDGKKYEKVSAHQKEWGARLISELSFKGNERVLDLGCGDGTNTSLIAEKISNGEVIGIDASQGMIEVARQKERSNLKFILMDIAAIEFAEQFDVVYSNATLHWVKNHETLLGNVFKSLRKGGILRFNFAADGNCFHFFKVIRKAMAHSAFSPYFKNFDWPWYMPSVDDYSLVVKKSDFQEFNVWGENADRFFPDTATMIGWVDQPCLVPFLACVSDRDKTAFRNFVVRQMIKETKQQDGRCFETFRRINLYAIK